MHKQISVETSMYSNRKRTTYLPTIHPLVSPPDVSTVGGGGPQVNKSEQVSSDGHQIPLAGPGQSGGFHV